VFDTRKLQIHSALSAVALVAATAVAHAETAPDALVKQASVEVIEAAKTDKAVQAGDPKGIAALIDSKVLPHVNFEVMTRSAVGPKWREASPEQRTKLQGEFKTLLTRAYAGALAQVSKEQTVEVTRTQPVSGSTQVVVQSEVRGKGEPIKLDYRLDKLDTAWKIIDVNIGGLWLVQNYRSQFAGEITKGGLDGLINTLVERNKTNAKG
jgi:phospholipid transport system substrate-binding protein